MFQNFKFTGRQVKNYRQAALKDFKIASRSDIPEVIFKFCYDSLLKLAIAVCAKNNLKVKSRQGHHIELINKLSDYLKDSDVRVIGNEMRSKIFVVDMECKTCLAGGGTKQVLRSREIRSEIRTFDIRYLICLF